MKSPFFAFLKKLTLFSLSIFLLAFLIFHYLIPVSFINILPFAFLFYFLLTAATHLFLLKVAKQRIQRFIPSFIGATALKLFISLTVLIIYVLLNRIQAIQFILFFFMLYICFSTFEIIAILRYFKKQPSTLL